MAGMFYDQKPGYSRSILDGANDAQKEQDAADRRRLQNEIDSFNALVEKHCHVMKLRFFKDSGRGVECLQLGTKEQFEYNVCQATLATGVEKSLLVATSLRIQHCSEWGE